MRAQRQFQDELDRLKDQLVAMAGLAEEAVRHAVESLMTRDRERAVEVVGRDASIDALELEIDDIAIQLLALQQPLARDLRFILTALNVSTDLERVGDHAVNIAEAVGYISEESPFPPVPEIEEMTRIATGMLGDALDAVIRGDSRLAREVVRRDDRVDELHKNVFRVLLTHMLEDLRKITVGMDLLLVSGNVERIADLATNIAEEAVYMVEGRTIKHHAEVQRAEGA